MNFIPFFSVRRSGHHAIMEWIMDSLSNGGERTEPSPNNILYRGDVALINDCYDRKQEQIKTFINQCSADGIKTILINYEDVEVFDIDYDISHGPFIVVRDIPNVFASRKKRGWNGLMDINEHISNVWVNHVNQDDNKLIIYEKWLTDKEYRDNFIKNNFNIINRDLTDYVPYFGNGSSFTDKSLDTKKNLLSRYENFKTDDEINKFISLPKVIESRKKLGYL